MSVSYGCKWFITLASTPMFLYL